MKAMKIVAALIGLGFVGSALAVGATVNVSANVAAACKVTQTGAVTFALDPTTAGSGSTPTSTTPLQYWCTKGSTITVGAATGANDSTGQKRLSDGKATPSYINYTFSTGTPTATTGGGAAGVITLPVGGSVADADFANSAAGTYTDSVTVTITAAP
jgi:spore coat protein U-like protein